MPADIDDEKRALRRRMRAAREAVPDRETRTRAILARADALLSDARVSATGGTAILGAYVGVGSEVDPAALLTRWSEAGGAYALPVAAAGRPLTFRVWRPGEPLRTGAVKVPEPVDGTVVTPTCLLVPLLAFDADRWRLGQGGGHYDRTLAQPAFADCVSIGLAFDAQMLGAVPRDRFDRRLSAVVTETRTLI